MSRLYELGALPGARKHGAGPGSGPRKAEIANLESTYNHLFGSPMGRFERVDGRL